MTAMAADADRHRQAEDITEYGNVRLLLVDDDETLRIVLGRALRRRGLEVVAVANVSDAKAQAILQQFDLAVVDLVMPGASGLELIPFLKQKFPAIRIVVVSGCASISDAAMALATGASNVLAKPADADEIVGALGCAQRNDCAR